MACCTYNQEAELAMWKENQIIKSRPRVIKKLFLKSEVDSFNHTYIIIFIWCLAQRPASRKRLKQDRNSIQR